MRYRARNYIEDWQRVSVRNTGRFMSVRWSASKAEGAFFDSCGMALFECFATVFLGGYIWRRLNVDVRNLSMYPLHKGVMG